MTRRTKLILVASMSIAPFLLCGGYESYWAGGAETAVSAAAAAMVDGRVVPNLQVEPDRAPHVAAALRGGFKVAGSDNIGLGFRAYEVKVRVRDGDQYNFDAYHGEDGWKLLCCNRLRAAELRE